MTHAELCATHKLPGGGVPSACPGELAELARHPDARLDPDPNHSRRIMIVDVVVYHCPACGMRLSVCEGTVLNAYVPAPPAAPRNGAGRTERPAP